MIHRLTAGLSRAFLPGAIIFLLLSGWYIQMPLLLVPGSCADVSSNKAREILEKIDDLWRSSSSVARLKMVVRTEHYTREMILQSWTKGKEKSLVRIIAPLKEKGTLSLKNDSTLYTYLPKTDRVIRLTSGMMMGSWMGSHFTNDDLVRESRLAEDYQPRILFEGLRDGLRIIEFELLPKPDAPVVWGRIIIEVLAGDYLPIRSRYYDETLKLIRTLEFGRIEEMDGRMLPTVLHMQPEDKPGEYTELTYLDIEFNVDLPDSLFSLLQLRRT